MNLKSQEKIIKYLKDVENPYILSFEGMVVEFEYANEKKTFNECMVNILKKKETMGWQLWQVTLQWNKWKTLYYVVNLQTKISSAYKNTIADVCLDCLVLLVFDLF